MSILYAMKKFLTAILFLMLGAVGYAQCINVQVTFIKGNCFTDNQIKVTARDMSPFPSICLPSSGKFIIELQGGGHDGDMFRMTQPSPGAPFEYTFYNLKAEEWNGTKVEKIKYKVIVRDEDTGAFDEREVDAESNYKLMNIQNLTAIQPVSYCGGAVQNGGVKFQIPNGGIGPFEVTLLKMDGTVLVPTQTFQRPANNGYIEVKSPAVQPNTYIIVQVKDKTNVSDQCGETRRYPSFYIPSVAHRYTVNCIEIKTSDHHMDKSDKDCSHYNMWFYLKRTDNDYLWRNLTDYYTELRDWFTKPGTAMVYFKNSSKPAIDFSSSFYTGSPNYSHAYYTIPNYPFAKGDDVEIVIKGPKNTIVERFKFDHQLDMPTGGCNTLIYNAYGYKYDGYFSWTELTCGTYTLTRHEGTIHSTHSSNTGRSASFLDPNTGASRPVYVGGWLNGYSNFKLQRKVGGNWVDEPSTYYPSTAGATYRYVYKNQPGGCPVACSNEFVAPHYSMGTIPPMPTPQSRPIVKIWDKVATGLGMYAGTKYEMTKIFSFTLLK